MGRLITFSFFLFLLQHTFPVWSQTTLHGTIRNEDSKPIASANILLRDSVGNILAYTASQASGEYKLKTNRTGEFTLFVNSIGYDQRQVQVILQADQPTIEVDLALSSSAISLEEIAIENVRPIREVGNKVIFDADYFAQGNEEVLEDLLKKIPGLSIESDGKIKVGNQEIEKIMIDGDDLFDKGYQLLSKNMPVHPVDKIELLNSYSNNKHLENVENSNRVALNLTFKEEYTREWFGNMVAGYGVSSESRHNARANLMNFGSKSKYYLLGNLNNIGSDATGDLDALIRPNKVGEAGSIGDNQSANALINLYTTFPQLKLDRININNAAMLSLNSIYNLGDKVKLQLSGLIHSDVNHFFKDQVEMFFAEDTFFENSTNFVGRKRPLTAFGKVGLNYDIASNQTLEYMGKFNAISTRSHGDRLFNADLLRERLRSNNQLVDQKLFYTRKLQDSRVWMTTARYISEVTPQQYATNQFLFSDLFSKEANQVEQYSRNRMQFGGVETHWMDRRSGGNLFELKAGWQSRFDRFESRFSLLDGGQQVLYEPDDYQNDMRYSTTDLYLLGNYRLKLGNLALIGQLGLHQLFNHLINEDESRRQSPYFVNPKVGLDWKISPTNRIITSYAYNTTNAGVLDVSRNFVQTGFRSFARGADDFNQLDASVFNINYTLGNWGDKFFANTFFQYTKNYDFFSTNSIISQNFSLQDGILLSGQEVIVLSSSFNRFLSSIQSNLKLNLTGTSINFKNVVNKTGLREIRQRKIDYGLELRSAFGGSFNYHLGSTSSFRRVDADGAVSVTDNLSFVDLLFMLSKKWNMQAQLERYYFGNVKELDNTYYFFDLVSAYNLKQNKLTLALSAKNLFDTDQFVNYNISDISTSTTSYRLIPRYVMLSATYRF